MTGWATTSPYGRGAGAFADGVRSGVPAPAVRGADDWFPEPEPAHLVPDFDIEDVLGRKGTGSMDRGTALAVHTVGLLRAEVGADGRTGVVLGTTSGSTLTQFGFTADSLTRRRPYFVNPAQMPFALMNSAAARSAGWHGLTGPNTTLAAGRLSGVAVLRYAGRLLRARRASGVFAGAVEEHSGARALLEREVGNTARLGEGAAVLFLRPASNGNRSAVAEVVATGTRLAADGEVRRALVECLRQTLVGVAPDEVWGLAVSGMDTMESDAVREVLGTRIDRVVAPGRLVGDTGAVGGVFGLTGLFALAERSDDAHGRVAVATAVDRDGMVGSVVVRLLGVRGVR
ncbi:3-oxoacyl-ACP synthase [Actinophytocola sp. S1-96]|uniref:3-oxoacyl-ACP synthase n=1 Tax=Actinophytocola gossypii TaxID=2812003 RepID=A0ABT2JHN1_9PSEU|nr:3-oxoacyl-ACP synthase [Actinophytocola gossypii]